METILRTVYEMEFNSLILIEINDLIIKLREDGLTIRKIAQIVKKLYSSVHIFLKIHS